MKNANKSSADKCGLLRGQRYMKNAFRPYHPAAYRPAFIAQVEENITALVLGELESAMMVRRHKRSMTYQLRIGFGKKNNYVRNDYHPQGEYLDYATVPEVIEALHVIRREAKEGKFDEGLDELLKKRRDHAFKMVEARRSKNDRKGTFASPLKPEFPEAA